MTRLIVKLLIRFLEKDAPAWYNGMREEKRKIWLLEQFQNEGMREYFKWRDLTILKTLGMGVTQKEHLMLVGQRLELLKLIGYAKEEYDREVKRKDQKTKEVEKKEN